MSNKSNISPESKEKVIKWWNVIKTVIDIIIAAITAVVTTNVVS